MSFDRVDEGRQHEDFEDFERSCTKKFSVILVDWAVVGAHTSTLPRSEAVRGIPSRDSFSPREAGRSDNRAESVFNREQFPGAC
jgi:hypothetical protein